MKEEKVTKSQPTKLLCVQGYRVQNEYAGISLMRPLDNVYKTSCLFKMTLIILKAFWSRFGGSVSHHV